MDASGASLHRTQRRLRGRRSLRRLYPRLRDFSNRRYFRAIGAQSELKQSMSVLRDRRRRRPRIESPDGLIASRCKRKCQQDCVPGGSTCGQPSREGSPCQCQQDSPTAETDVYSDPNLPEDVWHHIHSLMPLRDAARVTVLSQSFKCSWRSHPNLIFTRKTLGLDVNARQKETARDFRSKIDHILRNHSGIGVRKLNLWQVPNYNAEDCSYLGRWLQKAATPALEELTLTLSVNSDKYKFPCKLLSNGMGDSLRCLYLADCSFHPIAGVCCLKSLRKLELFMVINSPSVPTKFHNLKYVNIELGDLPFGRSFDCSSLVSLFGAALSLGTFISHVSNELMQHALVFGNLSRLCMSGTGGALSPENKKLVELNTSHSSDCGVT